MVRSHTEAEKKALPPPLSLLGCSTAAHSINLHKALTVSEREAGREGGGGEGQDRRVHLCSALVRDQRKAYEYKEPSFLRIVACMSGCHSCMVMAPA